MIQKRLKLKVQHTSVLKAADLLFSGSKPLPEFESKVLDETLKRLMKKSPSKPYRK